MSDLTIRCKDCGQEWDDMPFDHDCPNPQFAQIEEAPWGLACDHEYEGVDGTDRIKCKGCGVTTTVFTMVCDAGVPGA